MLKEEFIDGDRVRYAGRVRRFAPHIIEAIFLLLGRDLSFRGFFLNFNEKNSLIYIYLHIFVLSSINSCLRVFGQLFVLDFRVSKLG